MGVPHARWLVYSGTSYENLDDLGIPPFQETSIYIYIIILNSIILYRTYTIYIYVTFTIYHK